MEHKLIFGGEQFLPFARSRIKALRATGLSYASQQFEVDGVSIKVRIAGEHDYIRLEGASGKILSGVARILHSDTGIASISVEGIGATDALHTYKPTTDTWKSIFKNAIGKNAFHDEERLAIPIYSAIKPPWANETDAQHKIIQSSLYSGKMAKAVQIMLGVAKTSPYTSGGIQVKYNWRWQKTHGIITSPEGKCWLVEISANEGVIAMPLPISALSGSNLADKKAKALFRGLPTGESFAESQFVVSQAVAAGTVKRLITAAGMSAFHSKNPYSSWVGWSFNQAGTEAHNTCYDIPTSTTPTGYHYKVSFTFADEATPQASLSLVSSGLISRGGSISYPPEITSYDCSPFTFYEGDAAVVTAGVDPNKFVAVPGFTTLPKASVPTHKTAVFVCHINDVLEIVYDEWKAIDSTNPDIESRTDHGACASSTRFTPVSIMSGQKQEADTQIYVGTRVTRGLNLPSPAYPYYPASIDGYMDLTGDLIGHDRFTPSTAIFARGTRDGYYFFKPTIKRGVLRSVVVTAGPTSFSTPVFTQITQAQYNVFVNSPAWPEPATNPTYDYTGTTLAKLSFVSPGGEVYEYARPEFYDELNHAISPSSEIYYCTVNMRAVRFDAFCSVLADTPNNTHMSKMFLVNEFINEPQTCDQFVGGLPPGSSDSTKTVYSFIGNT